jgi:hypothetical protein
MNLKHLSILLATFLLPILSFTQVKIGDPTNPPDPKAILELKDTTRGFLLPRMTQSHMTSIATPPDGLLIYNNTAGSIYQYKQGIGEWRPIIADSSEWVYDISSEKLYLRRALNIGDSMYYNSAWKKWIFADTRFYRSSSGVGSFNLDEGNSDRFVFKTTASKYLRPTTNLFSANGYFVYEADNDTLAANNPFAASYLGLASDVTVLPSATQKLASITALRSFATYAGLDTTFQVTGIQNSVSIRGKGFVEVATGLLNQLGVRDSVQQIGLLYGINNTMSYTSPLGTPRILGDFYGYTASHSAAFNNKVDGNAYAIFLRSITAARPGNNWAIFTMDGLNHFGDSVNITETPSFIKPRAVFDVNATSSMIIPVGNTTQRPSAPITGMLRYNTDNSTPEAYAGIAGWISLKSPVISTTAILDPPSIASGATGFVFYTLTGAATGNTVTISPDVALPSGFFIAWARVSGVNQIQVGFGNISGVPIDLTAQNFYVKLVQ